MNFEEIAQLVRSRRTSLLIDRNSDVSAEMVQQLCELSTWAPKPQTHLAVDFCRGAR